MTQENQREDLERDQQHENGRNQAILDFYWKVKKNPYRRLSLVFEEIIEKYHWMCELNDTSAISTSYIQGFFGELHYMKWMAKENKLKVNQDVLDKI